MHEQTGLSFTTLHSENKPQGDGIQGFSLGGITGLSTKKQRRELSLHTISAGSLTFFRYTSSEGITYKFRWTTANRTV